MIPKILHIIWVGPRRFPYKENIGIWHHMNPEYKIMFWKNDNLPKLVNQKAYDYMTNPTAKTDILRLEVLYQFGGVYTDIDTRCLKPIGPLIENLTCFGMTGKKGNVANGFLGCTQHHPAFKEILEKMDSRLVDFAKGKKARKSMFSLTGTRYITPILRKYEDFVQLPRYVYCDMPEMTKKTYVSHMAVGYNKGHKKINMRGYIK